MPVCIYVSMYVCVCVCTYVRRLYWDIHSCMCLLPVYVRMCVYLYLCMRIYYTSCFSSTRTTYCANDRDGVCACCICMGESKCIAVLGDRQNRVYSSIEIMSIFVVAAAAAAVTAVVAVVAFCLFCAQ